jgi:hypothetical protein
MGRIISLIEYEDISANPKPLGHSGEPAKAGAFCLKCGKPAKVSRYSFNFCFSHDEGEDFDPEAGEEVFINLLLTGEFIEQ